MENSYCNVAKYVGDLHKQHGNMVVDFAKDFLKKEDNYMVEKHKIKTIALFYHRYRNGGIERVMSLLIPMYINMGYKTVLITEEEPNQDDYVLPEKVKRYKICKTQSVANGNVSYTKRANEIVEILKKENVDLVLYEASSSPLLFWDALTIKKTNVYCVLSRHELFSQENTFFYNYTDEHTVLCRIFDRVTVLSKAERNFLRIYGINSECIYNPSDVQMKVTPEEDRKDIVWVGRLEMLQKRYMDVVPIMKKVVEKCPDARLVIYGKGSSIDEGNLKEDIKKNNLKDNIVMAGYCKNVSEIYKTAKVHLVTSAYESFHMGIYESKLAGIPLVMYKMPYLELVKDGRGCISVEYMDYEAAAQAIVDILKNASLEKKLSKEARDSIDKFDYHIVQNKWRELFENIEKNEQNYIEEDEQSQQIISIMNKHFGIAAKKYNCLKERYKKELYKKMLMYVREKKEQEHLGVVIYPYGNEGKKIARFLQENDIEVNYVIDNGEVEGEIKAIKLEELKNEDCCKNIYIISNCNISIYDEIREGIRIYVGEDNIYDLYSKEIMTLNITNGLLL